MDSGRLPTIATLVERGAMGDLASVFPTTAPLTWTTVATGLRAGRHGILIDRELDPVSGDWRPVSCRGQTAKAIWNITTQNGVRSAVVNWAAGHPAEPILGTCVDERITSVTGPPGLSWPMQEGCVHPAHRAAALAELRLHPAEVPAEAMESFVPRLAEIDTARDDQAAIATLRHVIAAAPADLQARLLLATALLDKGDVAECRRLATESAADPRLVALAELLLGTAAASEGREDESLAHLVAEESEGAESAFVLSQAGWAHIAARRHSEAERLFRAVRSLDRDNVTAALGLAVVHSVCGRPAESADEALTAIGLGYFLPEAHAQLGIALVGMRRIDEAIQAFETSLAQQPSAIAHEWIARIHEQLNRDAGKAAARAAFRVIPAEGIDRRACRMLLPDRHGEIGWVPLFIAKRTATGSIVGAAKATPMRTSPAGVHLRVAIHVPAPFRRCGVGTALVRHAVAHARRLGYQAIAGLPEPEEREEAVRFLHATGFRTVDRMTTFEARADAMSGWLCDRRRWLYERGEIPPSARIVPLTEMLAGPVAAIYAAAIGGSAPHLETYFHELASKPDDGTVVLLVDGVVRGVHQCDSVGELSMTHALAVADELRGGGRSSGWAALLLLADRLEEGRRRGVLRSRFNCLSHARDAAAGGRLQRRAHRDSRVSLP